MTTETKTALVFGAMGSIGSFVYKSLINDGYCVYGTTTNPSNVNERIIYITHDSIENLGKITEQINCVVWANGDNCNDNITIFDKLKYDVLMYANVGFILETLNYLLNNDKLKNGSKLVIVSSIWQEFTRDNKLSYSISKSALSGLVKNTAYDLSKKKILINNVLPGVIDNDMSRRTLTFDEFEYIKNYSGFERLINLNDVYSIIKYLICDNSGITGQSIKVDLGFTNIKKYK